MSEMKFHTGSCKKIDVPKEMSFKVKVEYLKMLGYDITDWDEEYVECDNLVYLDELGFYELINHMYSDEHSSHAKQNGDVIDFTLSYYNGGCGFEEALESVLNDMTVSDSDKTNSDVHVYVATCDKCEWCTAVSVVNEWFDYKKWVFEKKGLYTNKRIHLELPHVVEISKETRISPDHILDMMLREYWGCWDWDAHIKSTKNKMLNYECGNCKSGLDLKGLS